MKYSKEVERHLLKTKIISSKSCEKFLLSLKTKSKRKNSFVTEVDSSIELIRKVMPVYAEGVFCLLITHLSLPTGPPGDHMTFSIAGMGASY